MTPFTDNVKLLSFTRDFSLIIYGIYGTGRLLFLPVFYVHSKQKSLKMGYVSILVGLYKL